MWSSMGITDKRMNSQDQIFLGKTGSIVDGWSSSQSNEGVKADTQLSCTNNVNSISWSKSTTSGSLYMYWHGSRPYKTSDSASCDLEITNSTQLCTVTSEGGTVTDLLGKHGSTYCGAIRGSYGRLAAVGLGVALAILY
jgi:hypothetical protein